MPSTHEAHRRAHWFDAHLDLAFLALIGRDLLAADPTASDDQLQPGAITLPSLAQGNVRTVLATIFTEPSGLPDAGAVHPSVSYDPADPISASRAGVDQLNLYHRLARDGHLRLPTSTIAESSNAPLTAGILIENAEVIPSPDDLKWWQDRGVVAIGLTWATPNRYASGNATPASKDTGLTAAGRELVAAMDELDIVHDASHLSDRSLEDLFAATPSRVIASHSNCRSLIAENQRHLTDDAIHEIARRDGVIGLNLYRKFLVPPASFMTDPASRPTIAEAIAHVERIVELTGSWNHVGLGSDADGGLDANDLPEGINTPRDYSGLVASLADRATSEASISAFMSANWSRVFPALAAQ